MGAMNAAVSPGMPQLLREDTEALPQESNQGQVGSPRPALATIRGTRTSSGGQGLGTGDGSQGLGLAQQSIVAALEAGEAALAAGLCSCFGALLFVWPPARLDLLA